MKKNLKRINLHFDPEDYDKLGAIADKQGITRSKLMRNIISEYLEKLEKDPVKDLEIQVQDLNTTMQTLVKVLGKELDSPEIKKIIGSQKDPAEKEAGN